MILTEDNYLEHYGILRKSGRYPWGSGRTQSIRDRDFLQTVAELRKAGLTDTEIARGFEISRNELQAAKSNAKNRVAQERINQAQRLKDKGYSNAAIARRIGLPNESSVRNLLAPGKKDKLDVLQTTANRLKDRIEEVEYVDVGSGVEHHIGISRTRLDAAINLLQDQGYELHRVKGPEVGGQNLELKVLGKPGSKYPRYNQINQMAAFSEDGGRTYLGIKPPLSISSKRIAVRYEDEGGGEADGVIYVRPGKKDLSIGSNHYGQVRIMVDGTHYLKGMAIYNDDLPEGVDLVFNTNKKNTGNKHDAMKPIKDDPDNPFGATIRQIIDPKTDKVTSVMNIVGSETKEGSGVEGSWEGWSKSLASQMLSKQRPELAKSQLAMLYEEKRDELDQIGKLTNPVIKRKLLDMYADDVDNSASHLEAAAMRRQAFHVILPIRSMKPTEIYAPNYKNGEMVALIRYPHGGTFEIPQLKVNNRNAEARRLLGTETRDAVGIHHKVAEHLSGADFDGDTVIVIPNNRKQIKIDPPLEGLKNFDPRRAFPGYPGMKPMTADGKQQEMGKITNLITDMTIHGANSEELARAIRHSMVVIDAETHGLDYRGSEKVNGIKQLRAKYQPPINGKAGPSTLLSRAGAKEYIPQRKLRPARQGGHIDPATGKLIWVNTGKTYPNKKGERTLKIQRVRRLSITENAFDLVSQPSPTQMELIYAEHSNKMKALANEARKESLTVKPIKVSRSAKQVYAPEVEAIKAHIARAQRNAPLERQARLIAAVQVSLRRQANPDLEQKEVSRIRAQALEQARRTTGASRFKIIPTEREWAAIQAGAISTNQLSEIMKYSDIDTLRQLAMPKVRPTVTPTKLARARLMLDSGWTQAEVADAIGVSVTTLKSSLYE